MTQQEPDLLFVYGTLHPDRASAEIAAEAARLIPCSPATIVGTLHQFPDYPAARLNPAASTRIPGHLFKLPRDPTLLARLDAYEGFLPEAPSASLFLRERTRAVLPDGAVLDCWVYTWNHPLPEPA